MEIPAWSGWMMSLEKAMLGSWARRRRDVDAKGARLRGFRMQIAAAIADAVAASFEANVGGGNLRDHLLLQSKIC